MSPTTLPTPRGVTTELGARARLERATYCLGGCLTRCAGLLLSRSVLVRAARRWPLVTVVFHSFWHGSGTSHRALCRCGPCLQSTSWLSYTVAHLGSTLRRVRWDRPVSVQVVVSLGGQSWTRAECFNAQQVALVADDEDSLARTVSRRRVSRHRSGRPRVDGYTCQRLDVDHRGDLPGNWCRSSGFCACHAQAATIKFQPGQPFCRMGLDSPNLLIRRDLRLRLRSAAMSLTC
jgi:hypothetical protein